MYNILGGIMRNYFNNILNKKFITSIMLLLIGQGILFVVVKLFQSNYHTFNYIIDNKIPFIPQMIIIYNLFYPMIFISFYNIFNHDKDTYYKGIIAGILGFIIADIIFLTYPVVMIRPDIFNLNIDPINRFIIYLTYTLDDPAINCFPSIHCLFCFQAIYSTFKCSNYNNKYKIITIIILLLIALSTLLVKQHYLFDVIGAFIVCIITNLITTFIYKKIKH